MARLADTSSAPRATLHGGALLAVCADCGDDHVEVRICAIDGVPRCLRCFDERATTPDYHYASRRLTTDPSMSYGLVAPSVAVGGSLGSRLARGLGLPEQFGEVFPCVLPGHTGHGAVLRATGSGYAAYACERLSFCLGFGELRASLGYGRTRQVAKGDLTRAEAAIWHDRAKHEAGLVTARAMLDFPPPRRAAASVLRVFDGWRLLVGIRDEAIWGNQPFAFARTFAAAWCGVTEKQARTGIADLEETGAAVRVSTPRRGSRKPVLFQPPGIVGGSIGRVAA